MALSFIGDRVFVCKELVWVNTTPPPIGFANHWRMKLTSGLRMAMAAALVVQRSMDDPYRGGRLLIGLLLYSKKFLSVLSSYFCILISIFFGMI